MKRVHTKNILTVLILLTVAFIWGNSLMPPEVSWRISNAVQEFLAFFTPVDAPSGSGGGVWSTVVRKLAHFTEFCVLGGMLKARWNSRRGEMTVPLFLGLLIATTDETIQAFTGRTSSVFDVWIDFAGVTTGVIWVAGFVYWLKRR